MGEYTDVESRMMVDNLSRLRIRQLTPGTEDEYDGDSSQLNKWKRTHPEWFTSVLDPGNVEYVNSGRMHARYRGRRKSNEFEDLNMHSSGQLRMPPHIQRANLLRSNSGRAIISSSKDKSITVTEKSHQRNRKYAEDNISRTCRNHVEDIIEEDETTDSAGKDGVKRSTSKLSRDKEILHTSGVGSRPCTPKTTSTGLERRRKASGNKTFKTQMSLNSLQSVSSSYNDRPPSGSRKQRSVSDSCVPGHRFVRR